MDFVGDIGGVPDFLIQVGGWIIASYAAFYASIATFSELYQVRQTVRAKNLFSCDSHKNNDDGQGNNIEDIHWSLQSSLRLWFGTVYSGFKDEKQAKYYEVIEKSQERQEEEFNLPHLIKRIRENGHQIKLIKTKLNMNEDSLFKMLDPHGVIDITDDHEYLEPLGSKRSLMLSNNSEDSEIWSNKIRQRSNSKRRNFQRAEDLD